MADRYWVGGTGTWNTTSTTNWRTTSGGSTVAAVPTVGDTVIFDGNSGGGGTFTVTMTGALNCFDMAVSTGGTVTFATGTTPTLNVRGSMTLDGATVWNSTGTVTFSATGAAGLTTNGVVMDCPIVFNGVGGNWTLNTDFAYGKTAIRAMTLTNGTINGNGFTVSSLFASTFTIQTNTNALNSFVTTITGLTTLASGTLNLSGGSFAGAFTHTSGTLNVTNDPVITGTYTFTAGALNLNNQSTTALTTGSFTYTAGTITLNSYTLNCLTWASTGTTARTFAFGTGNLTVRGSGASLFNMTGATNITTTGSKTVNITNATGTASTVASGALTEAQSLDFNFYSGGVSYSLTFLGTASHVARNVDFTSFSGTWVNSTGVVYGNLTLGSYMTLTESTSALTMGGTSGTKTITSNGIALKFPLTLSGAGSTFKLVGALTMGSTVARALTLVNGIFDLDGYSISLGFAGSTMSTNTNSVTIINAHGGIYLPFTITSGTCSIRGTSDNSAAAYFGSTFTLTAGTMTLTSVVEIAGAFTYTAGTINLSTFYLKLNTSYVASGATTRVINFGTGSYIYVTFAGTGTLWNATTIGTFSFTGTSDVRIEGSGGTVTVIAGAATEAQSMNFKFIGGSYTLNTTGSNFRNLILDVYNDGVNLNVWNIGTVTIYGNYQDIGFSGFGDRYFVPSISASILTFAGASGTKTILPIGNFRQPIVFNGAASIWQFPGNNPVNTDLVTLTAGTLDLATYNNTLQCGRFNTSGSTARTIAFGTSGGNIYVTGTGATATVFDSSTVTSLTLTGNPNVNIVSAATGVTYTVSPGAIAEASNGWNFYFQGAYTLTYLATAGHTAKNIDFTNFTGTWTAISTGVVYGNIILNGSMTITSSASALTLGGTSGTKTITSNGKAFNFPITLNAPGATWKPLDAFSLATVTQTFTHTNGTLDLNYNNVTVGTYATGVGTKSLIFNAGYLYVTGSGATAFNNANPLNYTVGPGGGYGYLLMSSATAKTFVGGGSTYDCYLLNSGAGALTISGNSTYASLGLGYTILVTGSNSFRSISSYGPSRVLTLTAGTTQTFTQSGNFVPDGSAGDLTTINSGTAGSLAFIARNYAVNDANYAGHTDYVSLKDIQFLPSATTGTGSLPNIWWGGSHSTNLGNNFGITFTDWSGNATTSIKTYYISSTSTTSWTTPADWNPANNTIHMIGAGGGGAGSRWTTNTNRAGGGGGGGGGYSRIINYSVEGGTAIPISIGSAGTGGAAGAIGVSGRTTLFGSSSLSSFYGASFNGTDQYLQMGATFPRLTTGQFLIEAWVYPTSFGTSPFIISDAYWRTGNNGGWFLNCSTSGVVSFSVSNATFNSFLSITSSSIIPLNTWSHVAVVRDSSNYITVYANGTPSAKVLYSASLALSSGGDSSTWATRIGCHIADNALYNLFNGRISNVRIVNGAPPSSYLSSFIPSQSALTNVTGTILLTLNSDTVVDNSTANGGSGYPITNNGATPVATTTGDIYLPAYYAPGGAGGSQGINTTTSSLGGTGGAGTISTGGTGGAGAYSATAAAGAGGGGGGGAAGPLGNGANGGASFATATTASVSGGGGGGNGGGTAGSNGASGVSGKGGNNNAGVGGGATNGAVGTLGGGGASNVSAGAGGTGGIGVDILGTWGGGGGTGGPAQLAATNALAGAYGAGGAGGGVTVATTVAAQLAGGNGGGGLIVIQYYPVILDPGTPGVGSGFFAFF